MEFLPCESKTTQALFFAQPAVCPECGPTSSEIQAELEADHRLELRKLDDFAFLFLSRANGDIGQAERLLDSFVDLIIESGVLSTWRYRLLLAKVREGL